MREAASARESPAIVAVLAGGLGRRVGGAKALVDLGGRTLISYPLQAAREAGLQAIILAKRDTTLPTTPTGVILSEPDHPRHPLCGVVTALRHAARSGSQAVLVVGCDMPFLTAPLLRRFASCAGETVIAELGGEPQPFPALYRPPALATLERALGHESSLRSVLRELDPMTLTEDELRTFGDPYRLFFSVNDARDLARARAWISAET
jgi:molybdenum cofactor guanylyltransferase